MKHNKKKYYLIKILAVACMLCFISMILAANREPVYGETDVIVINSSDLLLNNLEDTQAEITVGMDNSHIFPSIKISEWDDNVTQTLQNELQLINTEQTIMDLNPIVPSVVTENKNDVENVEKLIDNQKSISDVTPTKPKKPAKVAYLTVDDGPSAVTSKFLDILDEEQAKATFFMLEPNMRKYTQFVKRMADEGHALAMHGVTHNKKLFYKSKLSVVNEMKTGQQTIKKLTGVTSNLIRTPYGSKPYMKKEYVTSVKNAGFKMWDWNVDSLDWKYRDKRMVDRIKNSVYALEKNGQTPIILIHDRKETVKYLKEIITFLKDRGYKLMALDDTMAAYSFK